MAETLKYRWEKKVEALGLPDAFKVEMIPYGNTFLPKSAAPFVSFSEAKEGVDQSEFYGGEIDRDVFKLIGSDGAGNPICEDRDSGKVYVLDHDDHFRIYCFVNSSVGQLAECLLAFMGERDASNAARGVASIDPVAIHDGSFWENSIRELESEV